MRLLSIADFRKQRTLASDSALFTYERLTCRHGYHFRGSGTCSSLGYLGWSDCTLQFPRGNFMTFVNLWQEWMKVK